MTDTVIERLRSVDPARQMPTASEAAVEATRERIVTSPVDTESARSRQAARRPRGRRALVVALALALVVVVLPAAGAWAYFSYFMDRPTAIDEFHAAEGQMPLPAGAAWVEPSLPEDAVYGSHLGFIAAWGQATNAWLREWVAADEAGDGPRVQAAIAAVQRLIQIAPVHKDGDPEEAGGFVKESIAFFQGMVDRGKQGDFSTIKEYLAANQ
jgi:hypothetical protein